MLFVEAILDVILEVKDSLIQVASALVLPNQQRCLVNDDQRVRPQVATCCCAATAAACQNALLAATALGYGSMWRTGDCCYDEPVKAALGLSERDAIVGFLYLGSATPEAAAAKPPKVADLEGLVTHWSPS